MSRSHAAVPVLLLSLPAAAGPVATTVLITSAEEPTSLGQAPGDPSRLFFTERAGRVRIIKDGVLQKQPFLDITSQVSSQTAEQALACLTFHPDYENNRRFFVAYTDHRSNSVIARFEATADPDVADPASLSIILTVPQPDPTHNVGWLGFGPDGYLYVASGDGGLSTLGQFAQSTESLLGKLLRIAVDGPFPYAIPPGNPFVDRPGLDEIWAVGFRNPWRCSFDRQTGDLWIADVGQNLIEEIDLQPAGSPGGLNYGWDCMQGSVCQADPTGCTCNQPGLVGPVYEYMHSPGCAVIGGHVYRGAAIPSLQGHYVFGDLCTGTAWAHDHAAGTVTPLLLGLSWVYSFGEDLAGELYVLQSDGILKVTFVDCNANGVADEQDIADLTSQDCNGNGTPDECEPDCNANGTSDSCDIASGTSQDQNGNFIPDECDLYADFDDDGVVGTTDFLALLQAWGPCLPPPESCPADLNGDLAVEIKDLLILLVSWG
jgi:glucose/arabinose dehydrogenase